jgi:cytochrome c oxidase subunit II
VVPTDTTVVLEIEASDVIHSWWIPKFGPKADAVPGYVNESWFKVKDEGTYRGQCAELCGSGHADMRATVRAVSPDEFKAWADNKRREIQEAGEELAAQRKQGEGDEGK